MFLDKYFLKIVFLLLIRLVDWLHIYELNRNFYVNLLEVRYVIYYLKLVFRFL